MKEWQKELYIYRLSPAPPRKDGLQEYIDLYLAEKEEKYPTSVFDPIATV